MAVIYFRKTLSISIYNNIKMYYFCHNPKITSNLGNGMNFYMHTLVMILDYF